MTIVAFSVASIARAGPTRIVLRTAKGAYRPLLYRTSLVAAYRTVAVGAALAAEMVAASAVTASGALPLSLMDLDVLDSFHLCG